MTTDLSRLFDALPWAVRFDEEEYTSVGKCMGEWKTLIGIGLSPMTTDETLGNVLDFLFEEYPEPFKAGECTIGDFTRIVFPLGLVSKRYEFFHSASIHFIRKGPPQNLMDLYEIKGVGPKVANLYMSLALKKPTITIDTHTKRVLTRMGLWCKNEATTREFLMIETPKEVWSQVNMMGFHIGRELCHPTNPNCRQCPVKRKCEV